MSDHIKTLLNSLYGKFGETSERESFVFDELDPQIVVLEKMLIALLGSTWKWEEVQAKTGLDDDSCKFFLEKYYEVLKKHDFDVGREVFSQT